MTLFLILFLITLVIQIPIYLLWGWIFQLMWGWFVMTTFASAPSISIAEAIGIVIIAGFLTHKPDYGAFSRSDEESELRVVEGVVDSVLYPFLALFFAWIIHAWFIV